MPTAGLARLNMSLVHTAHVRRAPPPPSVHMPGSDEETTSQCSCANAHEQKPWTQPDRVSHRMRCREPASDHVAVSGLMQCSCHLLACKLPRRSFRRDQPPDPIDRPAATDLRHGPALIQRSRAHRAHAQGTGHVCGGVKVRCCAREHAQPLVEIAEKVKGAAHGRNPRLGHITSC